MIAGNKMVVSLNYRLTVSTDSSNGEELIEETESGRPFVFLFGTGGLLEEFEMNLKGKQAGDSFDFVIKSENGYGESSNENIVRIPMEAFIPDGGDLDRTIVFPGNFVPMVDESGHQLQGLVLEVNDDHVVMDFNHPLAGKDLHFIGSIISVRPASQEEIAHGHVHGEGGHHH